MLRVFFCWFRFFCLCRHQLVVHPRAPGDSSITLHIRGLPRVNMMKTTPTGSNASILRSLQMKAAVRKTMVMFVVCLVFGIINWVALGLPLLPTISDTWTKPPASYISRYVVGASSILFQVANFVIYRANQDVGKYAKASWVNKLSLVLSVVSVFALSWIGAVCDSKSSTCRGDNNVHMMFAYTFFIGYNMYMVIESVRAHKQLSCCAKVITTVCVLATLTLKLRVVPSDLDFSNGLLMETNQSIAAGLGNSFVAIFEWIDVLVVVVWTGTYAIHRGQGWSLATVQLDSGATKATRIVAADGTRVLNRVTAFTFATVVALVMTVLLISTFVVEVFITKAVPLPAVFGGNASWPLESALWVSAPGNWFARWALVFSAVFLLSYNSLAVITMRRQLSACLCCLTQFFGSMGALGVALSGCVDEYEESSEHALFMYVLCLACLACLAYVLLAAVQCSTL